VFVSGLIDKLEETRKDLERKSHHLHSVQRNFDTLSQQYKNELAEYNENKKMIAELKEENAELSSKCRTSQLR